MASYGLKVGFSIIIKDAVAGRRNFGTIGVFTSDMPGSARRVYTADSDGLAAMVVDGFSQKSFAYRAVSAIAAQELHPARVKIYKRATPNAQAFTLTPTATYEGAPYVFEASEVAVNHLPGATATVATICAALAATLDTVPNVAATDNTTNVTLALTSPTGARIFLRDVPPFLTVKETSPDAGIANALSSGVTEDPDFYGVIIDSWSEAENNAAASWCEANGRMFFANTIDSDVLDGGVTTDVASDFVASGFTYSGVFYSNDMAGNFAASSMSRLFATNPGASTTENKKLSALKATPLGETAIANAVAKRAGLYLPFGTLNMTHNISSGSGRFFDLTRDRDWLAANAQADLIVHLANSEKIPFNQLGIDGFEAVLRARFATAEDAGVLDPGSWNITLPTIAQVAAQKATRILTATDAFSGNFQGAIHGVNFSGALAV